MKLCGNCTRPACDECKFLDWLDLWQSVGIQFYMDQNKGHTPPQYWDDPYSWRYLR